LNLSAQKSVIDSNEHQIETACLFFHVN